MPPMVENHRRGHQWPAHEQMGVNAPPQRPLTVRRAYSGPEGPCPPPPPAPPYKITPRIQFAGTLTVAMVARRHAIRMTGEDRMSGQMIEFETMGTPASGYLATPETATASGGPGVVVLHAWWGLTEPFRQVCDRLAAAGFVALAPDLYRGKTTASVEEAKALVDALNQDEEQVRGDIAAAVQFLRLHEATPFSDGRGKLAVVG